MSHPLADEARTLNDQALADAINESYRALFNLQFQRGTHQLQDPGALGRARRQIARLRTVQRERALAIDAGAPLQPIAQLETVPLSPQKQRALDERAVQQATADAADAAQAEAADTPATPGDLADATLSAIADEPTADPPDPGDPPGADPTPADDTPVDQETE